MLLTREISDVPELLQRGRTSSITLEDRFQSQRLGSLLAYTETTSWLRVLGVCLFALAPAFTFTILIELLPLRLPSDGWHANGVFWARMFLSTVMVSFGTAVQTAIIVPAAGLTLPQISFIAIGTATGYTVALLIIANYWRFPIPFTVIVGNPTWQISRYVCLALVIGAKTFRANPAIKAQAKAGRPFILIQTAFLLIYPAYNALFLRLHGVGQLAFILVLSAIKYVMGRLLARVSKQVPATRALSLATIELFNALYLFKCMQSAGSFISGAGLIVIDLVHNVKRIQDLRKHIKSIKTSLTKSPKTTSYKLVLRESMSRVESRSQSLANIQPILVSVCTVVPVAKIGPEASSLCGQSSELDDSVQALLLECERIMIVEFIECVVPMFYSLYLVILFHLPNAKYYPDMEHVYSVKLTRTVGSIALYAALELVSLLYMHLLLHKKFNISALHLLANVLERDNILMQAVFTQWVIFVLQFTVQHNGT